MKGSKDWIRQNWDHENDTAGKWVLLTKLLHEWHIALPGTVAGVVVAVVFYYLGASDIEVASAFFGPFGLGYTLFFNQWWCSTIRS